MKNCKTCRGNFQNRKLILGDEQIQQTEFRKFYLLYLCIYFLQFLSQKNHFYLIRL